MNKLNIIQNAVTDTSILIYWDKISGNNEYQIYMDDTLVGTTKKTHYTINNLEPDKVYKIEIRIMKSEECIEILENNTICTKKRRKRLDITKVPYCAIGDGKTLNTDAIQKALNDCTIEEAVYIPKGIFMTGALRLHSNTELYLEEGAVLQGTSNVDNYLPRIPSRFEGLEMECYSSLLNIGNLNHIEGYNCENVLIHGKGTIASGGRQLAEAVIALEKENLKGFLTELGDKVQEYENENTIPGRVRPRLINISNCQNVRISGLALENGASWNVHMIYSDNILTDNCIFRSENVWNGDGWDPDSSTNCTILGSKFYTGDDSIAIKSGKNPEGNLINRPCEHIRIFDCSCAYGHGITIGSEMSGGVNDVKIWDCDLSYGLYGLEIKGTKKRGGYVRNVHVQDCILPRILFHSVNYNDDGIGAPEPPVFEKCSFTDIEVLGQYMDKDKNMHLCTAIELCGFDVPGHEIKDILFQNVKIPESTEKLQMVSMKFCENVTFNNAPVK